MRISKNFSLKELTRSQTAVRLGIDNNPGEEELINLVVLVHQILQPCRDEFGTVSVNSALRVQKLNQSIGSSDRSQHILGQAADFEAYSVSNYELATWIKDTLSYDQLILEYPGPDPRDGWVHCSFRRDGSNRKEVKTAVRDAGKTIYQPGLKG